MTTINKSTLQAILAANEITSRDATRHALNHVVVRQELILATDGHTAIKIQFKDENLTIDDDLHIGSDSIKRLALLLKLSDKWSQTVNIEKPLSEYSEKEINYPKQILQFFKEVNKARIEKDSESVTLTIGLDFRKLAQIDKAISFISDRRSTRNAKIEIGCKNSAVKMTFTGCLENLESVEVVLMPVRI